MARRFAGVEGSNMKLAFQLAGLIAAGAVVLAIITITDEWKQEREREDERDISR